MENVQVRRDIIYKHAGDLELKLDLYLPPAAEKDQAVPALIFVHGTAPGGAKDWQNYASWGRLAAA
jgi:acetyl esterase/lipase